MRRIPVYTPEWTDHNASDPGITLIELFAFLGENLLFRFNQIPEATKLAFLSCCRFRCGRRRRRTRWSTLERRSAPTRQALVADAAASSRRAVCPSRRRPSRCVWPLDALAVGARRRAGADAAPRRSISRSAPSTRSASARRPRGRRTTRPRHVPQDPSGADAQSGRLRDAAVDGALWIAVLRSRPTGSEPKLGQARSLNIGFIPDEVVLGIDDVDRVPARAATGTGPADDLAGLAPDRPMTSGAARSIRDAHGRGRHHPRPDAAGVVRLRLPDDPADDRRSSHPSDPICSAPAPSRRCSRTRTRRRLLFWLRASRRAIRGRSARVLLRRRSTPPRSLQTRTAKPEFLGTGTGDAGQDYTLVHHPVLAGTA